MEMMVYPGLFPSIWPIWDLEALLRNFRGAYPCAQSSSTCLWICHNCLLIYAASWTQLFPMSTVLKNADSLKTDWMLLRVFIRGACHQCGDWRCILCSLLGGRSLLSFVNLVSVGGATFHLFIPSSPILPLFSPPHPIVSCFSDLAENYAIWLPSSSSVCLPSPLFHLSFLSHLHTLLFHSPILPS